MSDIDKDLQRRLRDFADQISPEPGRSRVVIQSARTKRRLVALSAGLAVVLALGGLAGAATLLGDRHGIKPAPGPPSEPQQRSARYMFDVTEGRASATGILDVDAAAVKVCLTLASNNITASHVLSVDGDRPDQQGRIVFTFLDRDDTEQGLNLPMSRQCFRGEELGDLTNQLQLLVDEPERFAIDFHRGPNDDPALIAELVPVAQEQDLSGPLEDTIEAQGGTIRLQVIPDSIARGSIAEILVINETPSLVSYGHAYVLEERDPGGWKHVKSVATCAFTGELLSVAPGEEIGHPIGRYGKGCKVLPLRDGTYRVTKEVELASRERLRLSVTFSITPGAKERQILERRLADARSDIVVRELVRSFMERRMAGARAEEFLDGQGRVDFAPGGDLAPLYPDPPLQDFRIEFVDDLGDGGYEVGVSLLFQQGSYGETLFVRARDGELVISGGRPRLEGP